MAGESAEWQPIQKDVVDEAILFDPRMTDFDVEALLATFFSEGECEVGRCLVSQRLISYGEG